MALIPSKLAAYRGSLSDPGRRSKIPDAYLKRLDPRLYGIRQQNQANARRTAQNNAMYDPMQQLSGSQIYSLSKRLAGLQYNPQIDEATRQLSLAKANDAALISRVSGYNDMANSAVQAAAREAGSSRDLLAQQLASNNASLNNQINQDQSQAQQFIEHDAALRGGGNDGGQSARLAADFAQQRAGIQANAAAQEAAGNTQAQGWAGLLNMMQGATAITGADTLTRLNIGNANREAGLQGDINQLIGQRGSQQVQNIQSLRGSEFEKAVTAKTLGIKQQAADTQAATAAANINSKESTYDKETAKWAAKVGLTPTQFMKLGPNGRQKAIDSYNKKQRAARGAGKDGGKLYTSGAFAGYTDTEVAKMSQGKRQQIVSGYNTLLHPGKTGKEAVGQVNGIKLQTPLQQSHASSQIQHTIRGILPGIKSGKGIENPNYDPKTDPKSAQWIVPPRAGGYNRHQAANLLLKDPNSPDPALVSAALDIAYDGHISPGTAAKLHRIGLSVAALGLKSRSSSGVASYSKGNGRPD